MQQDVRDIFKVLALLHLSCTDIQYKHRCDDCPMKNHCLDGQYADDTTVIQLAEDITADMWQSFLDFADECLPSAEVQQAEDDARLYDEYRDRREDY